MVFVACVPIDPGWEYCADMKRALLFCLAVLTTTPVAVADPAIAAAMPVLRASLDGGTVRLRLADGLLNPSKPFDRAEILLVATDSEGRTIYESTTPVSRRATYASVEVPQSALSATKLTVRVK